jgi:hypothetical protein
VAEQRTVVIVGHGDLTVVGIHGQLARIQGDDEGPDIAYDGDTLRVQIDGDGRLQLPRYLGIQIHEASGDLAVHGLAGPVEIENVSGDLTVEGAGGDIRFHEVKGDASLKGTSGEIVGTRVSGDLTIHGASAVTLDDASGDVSIAGSSRFVALRRAGGDLEVVDSGALEIGNASGDVKLVDLNDAVVIERVGGDLSLRDCRGLVSVEKVGGDLSAHQLSGGLRAPEIGGDARLEGPFSPSQAYEINCNGDASIQLTGDPQTYSVRFELERSSGGPIKIAVPLADLTQSPGRISGRLGDGEATVRVRSRGDLKVGGNGRGGDWGGLFEDFAGQLGAGIAEEISASIEAAMDAIPGVGGTDLGERIRERTTRISQHAEEAHRRHIERNQQRAQEAMDRARERMQRQSERWSRGWRQPGPSFGSGWAWPTPPPPPAPPPPPPRPRATEEERLTILRMVAEGKIGPEDAVRLLEALGE